MHRGGAARRTGTLALVAGVVTMLALTTPVQAACADETTDTVLLPSGPYHGPGAPCVSPCLPEAPPPIAGTEIPVPDSWGGQPFVLTGGVTPQCIGCVPTNPFAVPPDFAVSWIAAEGYVIDLHANEGDERGVVPVGAASAVVTFQGLSIQQAFRLSIDCDDL